MSRPSSIGVSLSWSPQMSSTGRCRLRQQPSDVFVDQADQRAAHHPGRRAIVRGPALIRVAPGGPAQRGGHRRRPLHRSEHLVRADPHRTAPRPPRPDARAPGQHHPAHPSRVCRGQHDADPSAVRVPDQVTRLDPEAIEQARRTTRRSRGPTRARRAPGVAPKPGRSGTIRRRPGPRTSRSRREELRRHPPAVQEQERIAAAAVLQCRSGDLSRAPAMVARSALAVAVQPGRPVSSHVSIDDVVACCSR